MRCSGIFLNQESEVRPCIAVSGLGRSEDFRETFRRRHRQMKPSGRGFGSLWEGEVRSLIDKGKRREPK